MGTGDRLYAYVYLDQNNPTQEVMLQWNDGTTWHNAYWGGDRIDWVGARTRMGDIPASGQWVRLEVLASTLGLEGKTLSGMAFNLWGGRATWDRSGKSASSALAGSSNIQWLVSDQLGTARMVIDQTGSLAGVKRHDYLPFGEELGANVGGRTPAQGYAPTDDVRQRFAGYEREVETGLDFAQARFYSSTQGRFTSVDPLHFQSEMLIDPQRFNLYPYARNNPLTFIDPTGEKIRLVGSAADRARQLDDIREAVGAQAGGLLYERREETRDADGNVVQVDYYVGILESTREVCRMPFESVNDVAAEIGEVIRDDRVVDMVYNAEGRDVKFDDGATFTTGKWTWTDIGPYQIRRGGEPGVTGYIGGRLTVVLIRPETEPGWVPAHLMTNGKVSTLNRGILTGHELGHVAGVWKGLSRARNLEKSVELENKVRKLQNPNGPLRRRHG